MSLNLTKRQAEICTYLVHGKGNEEIAEVLKLSKHTIKAYISAILSHFKVTNRTELAYILGKENFSA